MAKAKKKKVTLSEFNGDHGTGTLAAKSGTVLEPMTDERGNNPNKMARRRRRPQSAVWEKKLSMRQKQAAEAIETAYAAVQALGSGGDSIGRMIDLRVSVDASPKPDATVSVQAGRHSRLITVMAKVPTASRPVIEHMFWHGRSLGSFAQGRDFYNRTAEIKVALDLVANHMRY